MRSAPVIETMSPLAAAWLRRNRAASVLSVFDRVCNLIDEQGAVMALVAPQIGNGPFHAVLSEPLRFSALLQTRLAVSIGTGRISAEEVDILFGGAELRSPAPDWAALRLSRAHIEAQARRLAASLPHLKAHREPQSGLSRWGTMPLQLPAWHTTQAAQALSLAVAKADLRACATSAAEQAGLGPGSTPSGDDHLLGAMYAAWLIHPGPVAKAIASSIVAVAAPRTTSLSASWLRAACRGECGAPWHELTAALAEVDDAALRAAAGRILRTGASSGEEALAAFLGVFLAHAALERTA